MLTRVAIANFRSLKQVEVPLAALTVLIGPNDTGKSAFLTAIQLLLDIPGVGLGPMDLWRGTPVPLAIRAQSTRGELRFRASGNLGYSAALFRLPSSQLVTLQAAGYSDGQTPLALSDGAPEVPALVDYLLRRDRKRFFAFVDAAKALIPGLQDIEVGTPAPHIRELVLVADGFRVPSHLVSSGVRLLLFFLALAYHPQPCDIWLIEEPENGMHPKRLAEVMSLLRDVTRGVHASKPSQVILTTHSPYVLDCVDLERDQVLVFQRNEDGSRTAEPADRERLKTFLGEFMLGEVWFNQGEAGLVSKKG